MSIGMLVKKDPDYLQGLARERLDLQQQLRDKNTQIFEMQQKLFDLRHGPTVEDLADKVESMIKRLKNYLEDRRYLEAKLNESFEASLFLPDLNISVTLSPPPPNPLPRRKTAPPQSIDPPLARKSSLTIPSVHPDDPAPPLTPALFHDMTLTPKEQAMLMRSSSVKGRRKSQNGTGAISGLSGAFSGNLNKDSNEKEAGVSTWSGWWKSVWGGEEKKGKRELEEELARLRAHIFSYERQAVLTAEDEELLRKLRYQLQALNEAVARS